MTILTPSIEAHRSLPGTMTYCSWRIGWRALLLRAYDEPGKVEAFTTAQTPDQLIVLVVSGGYRIEAWQAGRWREAHYAVGSLGMSAAGENATLRWRSGLQTSILQMHLPGQTIRAAAEALWGRDPQKVEMPNALVSEDAVLQQIMLALQAAAWSGAPEMYAETAAAFLAVHLLRRHAGFAPPVAYRRDESRLRRVETFMRENLSAPLSLEDLAREAGFSRFHLVRMYKKAYGETPFRRLTRLRIELALNLLSKSDESVTQIALRCGYDSPPHFAVVFRRSVGVSPTTYRQRESE